jgi:16S rRNA A1518/A1519 N6-dimethyltransferase RsmA/KsgA/DIM1 with predicted DNA glycosylase/AP lyase activity
MYVGPVTVDETKIADFVNQIPKDSGVLELGAGIGDYSVAIRRRTQKFLAIEPDARLIRCIIANAETHFLQLGAVNAMISPVTSLSLLDRTITEDSIFEDDRIRSIPLEDVLRCVGHDFDYVVVHQESFFDHMTKYYPDFMNRCNVLKSYAP